MFVPNRGAQLLAEILERPWTKESFARACGKLSGQAVSHWLSFTTRPDAETRKKIAEVTNGAVPESAWDETIDVTLGDEKKGAA